MALRYKVDILPALKAAGYNTGRIRKEKLFSESTLQKFRQKEPINFANLDRLCTLLQCQPGDLIEHVLDEDAP